MSNVHHPPSTRVCMSTMVLQHAATIPQLDAQTRCVCVRVVSACTYLCVSGDPCLYEHSLTHQGVQAARAAAAAATTAATGLVPPDVSAAAGVEAAQAMDTHTAAADASTTTAATVGGSDAGSSDSSAFAPEAVKPRLPLLGGGGGGGVDLCPGVPSTAALGVKGGLTQVVPAELHLPKQHAALFR